MSDMTKASEAIKARLAQIRAPKGEGDLVSAGFISEVELEAGEATVVLRFEGVEKATRHQVEDEVRRAVAEVEGVVEVFVESEVVELSSGAAPTAQAPEGAPLHQITEPRLPQKPPMEGIRNILAVASGKGGVGKSTVAVNLALALKARGAKVGICDIDVYGPSVPMQMGVGKARPGVSPDQKRFLPVEAYGVKVMSIGFLVDDDTPVIWRGPIVASVVKQFLADVDWGQLDYLVIDLPPGTGDAQLTLTQTAPITGALIVTTPSELALIDAVKGLQMFRKVDVPVLGLVENMSHYVCGNCGHESQPFNSGGTARVAAQMGLGILAKIPIEEHIQRGGDEGKPVVAVHPDTEQARSFLSLADAVMEKMPIGVDEAQSDGFLKGLFRR
ncbi:Mrp/NBP35 family ATP-binding protein [Myxococcota bacterium]|nr:Mrp/NBP35 family ATP-binding protein [Myxococcota bacterium]MBU1429001.1 Mrp/NBP35 family ATP-binding protein [Myxococcota bacterium]MBU1896990.1 Mrp/NBP35 family ATP-binding protein [Myxococcota bacterium]